MPLDSPIPYSNMAGYHEPRIGIPYFGYESTPPRYVQPASSDEIGIVLSKEDLTDHFGDLNDTIGTQVKLTRGMTRGTLYDTIEFKDLVFYLPIRDGNGHEYNGNLFFCLLKYALHVDREEFHSKVKSHYEAYLQGENNFNWGEGTLYALWQTVEDYRHPEAETSINVYDQTYTVPKDMCTDDFYKAIRQYAGYFTPRAFHYKMHQYRNQYLSHIENIKDKVDTQANGNIFAFHEIIEEGMGMENRKEQAKPKVKTRTINELELTDPMEYYKSLNLEKLEAEAKRLDRGESPYISNKKNKYDRETELFRTNTPPTPVNNSHHVQMVLIASTITIIGLASSMLPWYIIEFAGFVYLIIAWCQLKRSQTDLDKIMRDARRLNSR